MIRSGEIDQNSYNRLSYAFSDITGDGTKEMVVCQQLSKHLQEYWIYRCEEYATYYIGEFQCDARNLYGYEEGILYEEYYKGSYELSLAVWDGNNFNITTFYEGSYDRNGNPPAFQDLDRYYDEDGLFSEISDFKELELNSTNVGITNYGGSYADNSHDLSNFGYRTVNTARCGALVFQTKPGGSFLSD